MTVFLQDADVTLLHGDVLDELRGLPSESVDCVVTSPPYWNLRDYGTGAWEGGDEGCDHGRYPHHPQVPRAKSADTGALRFKPTNVCGGCGARRIDQQLGLEPTPDEFVASLVAVFREVRRVLCAHGTCWVNLGDSYHGGGYANYAVNGPEWLEAHGGDRRRTRQQDRINANPELKPKDLVGVPWRVAFALQQDGWWLRSDIVWCLSGGTRLYARTQKGEQPQLLKDLVRLDPSTVQLWNGERWTQVVSWLHAESRGEPLEIELASGERLNCTPGHVWPTQRGNVRADELAAGDEIATTRLPEPDAPERPEFLPDTEIGYLVGRYLADGSASGDTVQIACHTDEADGLAERLGRTATALHGSAVAHRTKGKSATVNLHGPLSLAVIRAYVHGNDAKTKGLRARAWRRSNTFLAALLDGYLYGDAHWDEKNLRYRLGFTRNDRLAADLRTLAARLGCSMRLSLAWVEGFGERWPAYRGDLRLATLTHHNARKQGRVVAIRRSRGRQFWDVEVADDPHLFALASGVLTHNSKPNPMPESVTDRPTKAHEYVFLLAKQPRYWFDAEAVREPFSGGTHSRGSTTPREMPKSSEPGSGIKNNRSMSAAIWGQAAPTPPQAETLGDLEPEAPRGPDGRRKTTVQAGDGSIQHRDGERWAGTARNVRTVWTIATSAYSAAHFATFPEELVRRCILAGCPERVCLVCSRPWERVTETARDDRDFGREQQRGASGKAGRVRGGSDDSDTTWSHRTINGTTPSYRPPQTTTLGWEPTCDCHEAEDRTDRGRDPGSDLAVRGSLRGERRGGVLGGRPGGVRGADPQRQDEAGLARRERRLLDAYSRPGRVLDPFVGSGTTCKVARDHGRHSVGIDLSAQYLELAAKRLSQQSLFSESVSALSPPQRTDRT